MPRDGETGVPARGGGGHEHPEPGGGAPRRRGGLFWHRKFRLLWFGETVSGGGNSMAAVLIPLLAVTTLHASTFQVAALTAAGTLPWFLIGLPAGAWVDRRPARTVMITCDLVSAALYASLPAAAWLGVLTFGQLGAVALLAGAAGVLFATAYQVYLPSLIPPEDLVEGNAKLQGSASAAAVAGRGLGGVTASAVGAAGALLYNAASFLVSAACLLRIGPGQPRPQPAPRAATVLADIAEGARFIVRDPYLRPITTYAAVSSLMYGGYTSLAVVFLVRVAGIGPAAIGWLMAAAGAGGILGALIARRAGARVGTARALLLAAVSDAAGLLLPLTRGGGREAWFLAGVVILSAGSAVQNIIVAALRQAYPPPGIRGRVVAGMRFLTTGAVPAGALLAGGLATALGVRAAMWIVLSALALSGALLCTPALLSARDLPRAPAALA